ncbi:hypothetical protein FRACA_540016 [Frankia canadensis]|uniref:Uncharacterized protein n=1 Tax=Frankia canadensis TaxID=1836972 RepID=A0A2I2KYU7_9ACTN|nr:hypothetical protein FRACA_540016 [Frankia canadensis]SOU58120.1 hypothetical protein FRACA_540016 [Frankia canadensis]
MLYQRTSINPLAWMFDLRPLLGGCLLAS